MSDPQKNSLKQILAHLPDLLPTLEEIYKDVHAHPELSMQETRTAGLAAKHLANNGYEVTTGVGKTGVVGLLRAGEGPTVMLRADMDALPVGRRLDSTMPARFRRRTSPGRTVPVAHACGHDMHVAWLMGASTILAHARRMDAER